MVGVPQPLADRFAIVDANGMPTPYFTRWAQKRQSDLSTAITSAQANALIAAYVAAHPLQAGSGITITPDGKLSSNPTITASVQAILDQLTTTRGSVLYRGASGWAALPPGTAGQALQTNGAGADPSWVTPAAGGGTKIIGDANTAFATNANATFSNNFWGGRAFYVPYDITVSKLRIYCNAASATAQVAPVIYNTANRLASGNTLAASGSFVTGMVVGANDLPLSSPLAMTAGQVYWLGIQVAVAGITLVKASIAESVQFSTSGTTIQNPAPAITTGTNTWGSMFVVGT